MNLLVDDFISTTKGKISLRTLLTSDDGYQLQYAFDETQLAMLQLLSSLATVVLKPTLNELRGYLNDGISEYQYDVALDKIELKWFDGSCFMRSSAPEGSKMASGPVTKLVSGVECGGSPNALGLFSDVSSIDVVCTDCTHVLNYNLHMNIKGECFGPTGATGIRGGGTITTLISGEDTKSTVISNVVAVDYFDSLREIENPNNKLMWEDAMQGDVYYAHDIGLERGLFALAYHVDFPIEHISCLCDVCGCSSDSSVTEFLRLKYSGSYGSTKNGRDAKAHLWPHPYTPVTLKEEGEFPVCARDQYWQSWQEFSSYVVGRQTDKSTVKPALIVSQYQELHGSANLLVGGNVADQGSIIGRIYDLYSMPDNWKSDLGRVTKVIDVGLSIKDLLSQALNKIFGSGYDKRFVGGIKDAAMHQYTSNAQQIVQQLLLDVDRRELRVLRKEAVEKLKAEAKRVFDGVVRKYQHELPLFKALVKGEHILNRIDATTL